MQRKVESDVMLEGHQKRKRNGGEGNVDRHLEPSAISTPEPGNVSPTTIPASENRFTLVGDPAAEVLREPGNLGL